jgi:hypothetical protein
MWNLYHMCRWGKLVSYVYVTMLVFLLCLCFFAHFYNKLFFVFLNIALFYDVNRSEYNCPDGEMAVLH